MCCEEDDDVQRIELTVIHKEAEVDVWTRLGLWPDQEDDELDEEECPVPAVQSAPPRFR